MNAMTFLKEFDTLAESMLQARPTPKVDIWEGKDGFQITVDLPGYSKDQVTLQIHDGVLQVEAKPNEEATDEGRWLVRERGRQGLKRTFRLPREVDVEAIQATFRDGLLVLTLPKKPEAQPRTITIAAA